MTSQANPAPDPGHLGTRTPGDIATPVPGATGVFRRYRLDFCCGGDMSPALAATRRGPDPAAIGRELLALGLGVATSHPDDPAELARYIVARSRNRAIPSGATGHSDSARA